MIPYPSRARALHAVQRRRNACRRAQVDVFESILDDAIAALSGELGYAGPKLTGMTADLTRPQREAEARAAARARRLQRQLAPAFERHYLNTVIKALHTPTISTA